MSGTRETRAQKLFTATKRTDFFARWRIARVLFATFESEILMIIYREPAWFRDVTRAVSILSLIVKTLPPMFSRSANSFWTFTV